MDVYLLNVFIFNSPNERKEIFKQQIYSTIYLTPSVSYYNHLSLSEIAKERKSVQQSEQSGILSASIIINNLHLGGGSVSLPKFSDGCRQNILSEQLRSSHLAGNDKPSSADTRLPWECNCSARKQGKQAASLHIHTGDSEGKIFSIGLLISSGPQLQ